jgi:hypothetical protein
MCQDLFWKEGHVILKDGVQKEGFVLDKEWSINPVTIEFKESSDGPVQKYTADELSEFYTSRGVRYKAIDVSFDGDSQNLNSLPFAKDPMKVVKGRVLLQLIVDGAPSLLLLRSQDRKQYFLEENGNASELIYRHYGPRNAPETNKMFKQQIMLISNGCPEVQSRLKALPYTEVALVNIIKQINNCRKHTYQELKSGVALKDRRKPNIGIAVEGYLSHVEFQCLRSPYSVPNFGFGVFTELYSKRRPNTLSVYAELAYRSVNQKTDMVYYNINGFVISKPKSVQIRFDRIKLTSMIRIARPGKGDNGRLFGNIGLTANARMGTFFEEDVPDRNLPQFKNQLEFGFAGGVGYGWFMTDRVRLNTELRGYIENFAAGSSGFMLSNAIGLNIQLAF